MKKIRFKDPEQVLRKILYEQFEKDFVSGNLCASDQIYYITQCPDEVEKYWLKWLEKKGFEWTEEEFSGPIVMKKK